MPQPLKRMLELLSALEAAQIPHCHFKSNLHLGAALAGETDYDLLVAAEASAAVERHLGAGGFKRALSQPWARFPGVEDWIGFDEATSRLIHVHLHFTLITGTRHVKEQRVPWEAEILATTIVEPTHQARIIEPHRELLLFLIRLVFKTPKGCTPPKHIQAELAWLKGRVDPLALAELAARLLPRLRVEGLWGADPLSAQIDEARAPILAELALHRRFSPTRASAQHRLNRARFHAARVARRLGQPTQWGKRLHSGGRLIAIIGCDGAGKSTLTQDLKQWLAWKLDADTIYLGVGDGHIGPATWALKHLALVVERRRPSPPAAQTSAPTCAINPPPPPPPSAGRWLSQGIKDLGVGGLNLTFARERADKLKAATALRHDGLILLTDRFPQIEARGVYDGPRTQRKAEATFIRDALADQEDALFAAMTQIKPDLIIRLKITVEVALSRKPEHREPEMRRKVAITDQLRFQGAPIVEIDATRPFEEVRAAARRAVWGIL
ncbi:hypothetical protein KKB55_00445 [Myxococcota bacterium]|nr:hypothetical protein [Myxococcota bacterium]